MIGRELSHYRITGKLGAGGMGEVYRARDTKLDRDVALKILPSEMAQDPERLSRFDREAKAVAALKHPHIVTIYSVEEAGGIRFLTMELVEGQTLTDLIPRRGFALDRFFELAIDLTDAMAAAHAKNITHRDLKPANIMLDADGRLKVLDFGLAKLLEAGASGEDDTVVDQGSVTQEGRVLGTAAYMSPEQAEGKPVDHRSDIFSLGIILYEIATGERPFQGETTMSTLSAILKDTPPTVTEVRGSLPRHLGRIIARCLAKDPARRHQVVADLRNELEALKEEVRAAGRTSATESGAAPITKGWLRGRATAGIAALLALVVVVAIWQPWSSDAPGPKGTGEDDPTSRIARPEDAEALDDRKTIVVLPFENLGSIEDGYFADGLTDEITSRLAGLKGLGVISRTSAMRYKADRPSLRQIGEELGVDYVLEGTVRWEHRESGASRVLVTPQLIRVQDDTHIWADRYLRELAEIFAVQADIAREVANELDITLLEREEMALDARPTGNLAAYEMYLRGLEALKSPSSQEADFLRAVEQFQQAAELDPDFAMAFVRLSEAHGEMFFWGFDRSEARVEQAKSAIDRALALQPGLPEAHRALGSFHYMVHMDYGRALAEFAIAAEGLPNDPELMETTAYIWRRQGLWEPAIGKLHEAARLDPQNAWLRMQLGFCHAYLRNYADADRYIGESIALEREQVIAYSFGSLTHLAWKADLEKARATLEAAPDQTAPLIIQSWFMLEMGARDYQSALDHLDGLSGGISGGTSWVIVKELLAGFAYEEMENRDLARGAFESARVTLEKLVEEQPAAADLHGALGRAYAGLGRREDAVREGRLGIELARDDALRLGGRYEGMAMIHLRLGEHDAAIDMLERALSIPGTTSAWLLRLNPQVDPIRDNPRFQQLIEEHSGI
jgi:TolB-like protein/Flp pilus assembly protein TadD